MKNILVKKSLTYLLVAACISYVASSCVSSKDYLSKNFEHIKTTHKVIAILPFDVRFANNQNPKNQAQQRHFWTDQERQGSMDMQRDLFVDLVKQVEKKHYELTFQDFTKTNKILQENGVMLQDIAAQDKGKLAQLLGVDAVVWGQTDVKITRMNNNRYGGFGYGGYNSSRYNDGVETTANIFDAATGEMVWSTNQTEHPNSAYNTPHDLASRVMEYVAKRLPYRMAKR